MDSDPSQIGLGPQPTVQDLGRFSLPDGFRGRPAWFVQLWWLVQSVLFATSPQVLYGWRRFLLRLFGADVAGRAVAYLSGGLDGGGRPFPDLTERERDVLELVAQGQDNGSIARTLFVSAKTVRNYVYAVMTKLDVQDRGAAGQRRVRRRPLGCGRRARQAGFS